MAAMRLPALALLATVTALLIGADPASSLRLTQIGSFDQPVHVEDAPGKKNRKLLFVVEKPGRVMVVRNGTASLFLDLTDIVLGPTSSEQGLLSIAFHPRYERNRLFYVFLTDRAGDNAVYEFKRSKKSRVRAVRFSQRVVLQLPHPDDAANHNGGQLQFGPERGKEPAPLYISVGDGGSTPTAAQDLFNLNGKLLRINPTQASRRKKRKGAPYGIPADNPFRGAVARPEVYSLGLRNPWRFSFDAGTGAIVIGDVGSGAREEVDYRLRGGAAGVNFGWPRFEGTLSGNTSVQAPGAVPPTFEYATSAGSNCAITGGYVVRDRRLASLQGRYIYSDFCAGDIRTLNPLAAAGSDVSTGLPAVSQLSSFGEGRNNILFVTQLSGPVYRLDP
jgi:glucose/arabinose dehydrogenase